MHLQLLIKAPSPSLIQTNTRPDPHRSTDSEWNYDKPKICVLFKVVPKSHFYSSLIMLPSYPSWQLLIPSPSLLFLLSSISSRTQPETSARTSQNQHHLVAWLLLSTVPLFFLLKSRSTTNRPSGSHSTREKEAFPSSVMTNWLTSSMDNRIDHTNQTWHGSSAAAPLKKSRWCLFLSRLRNFALHSYPSNRQTGSGTSWTPKIVDRKRVCQSSNRATSILFSFCYSTPKFISSSPSWMTTE